MVEVVLNVEADEKDGKRVLSIVAETGAEREIVNLVVPDAITDRDETAESDAHAETDNSPDADASGEPVRTKEIDVDDDNDTAAERDDDAVIDVDSPVETE